MDPVVPLAPNTQGISYIAFRARWRDSLGCCGVRPGQIWGSPISCTACGVLEAEGHEARRLPAGFWAQKSPWEVQVSTHPKGIQRLDPSIMGLPAPQIFSTHLMWLGLGWPNPRIWDLQRLQDGIVGLEHPEPPNLQCKEGETCSWVGGPPKVAQGAVQGPLFFFFFFASHFAQGTALIVFGSDTRR